MAEHKNQHIIPRTYLEKFITSELPAHLRNNPKVEPGVFVRKSNSEDGWKMVSIDHRTFTSSYFYNSKKLVNEQYIETNVLADLEGKYNISANKLINREPLVYVDKLNLLVFITAQFFRTRRSQSNLKESNTRIAEMFGSFYGREYFEKYRAQVEDLEKLSLMWSDEVMQDDTKLILIENYTKIPFITSDNPVVRHEVRFDQLAKWIPNQFFNENIKSFEKTVLFFMALSPTKAIILSKDIKVEYDLRSFKTDSIVFANIFYDLAINNSDEFVVADRDKPDSYCRKVQTTESIRKEVAIKYENYIQIDSEVGVNVFQIEGYESTKGFYTMFQVKLSDRNDLDKLVGLTGKILSFHIVNESGTRFSRENKTVTIVDQENAIVSITR